MSKRVCKDYKELKKKLGREEAKFMCKKCESASPKEKWLCKPKAI